MPLALYALTAEAFGIGITEFVIMGLVLEISADFSVSIVTAGLLISGYALGVVGAPVLTVLTDRWPRKSVLMALMAIFIAGNAIGAWAGGLAIDHGPGLVFVPLVSALFPLAAIGVAGLAAVVARRSFSAV